LLQLFYSIRSERQLMERLDFDLLFRWFVGLGIDDPVWDATVFSKNRDRLLNTEIAQGLSDKCVKASQKEISFLFYPNSADTYLAVANGRGDGFLTGKATGLYIAQHNDKLQMTESTLAETASIAGIVVAKDNTALYEALRLALESAISDGGYRKILDEFGVGEGALTINEVRNPPDM
jgi:hypothetical protein